MVKSDVCMWCIAHLAYYLYVDNFYVAKTNSRGSNYKYPQLFKCLTMHTIQLQLTLDMLTTLTDKRKAQPDVLYPEHYLLIFLRMCNLLNAIKWRFSIFCSYVRTTEVAWTNHSNSKNGSENSTNQCVQAWTYSAHAHEFRNWIKWRFPTHAQTIENSRRSKLPFQKR